VAGRIAIRPYGMASHFYRVAGRIAIRPYSVAPAFVSGNWAYCYTHGNTRNGYHSPETPTTPRYLLFPCRGVSQYAQKHTQWLSSARNTNHATNDVVPM
ncbi:MAG: hypothetical protein ACI308_02045, partial [Muribaculaceae bacterium]